MLIIFLILVRNSDSAKSSQITFLINRPASNWCWCRNYGSPQCKQYKLLSLHSHMLMLVRLQNRCLGENTMFTRHIKMLSLPHPHPPCLPRKIRSQSSFLLKPKHVIVVNFRQSSFYHLFVVDQCNYNHNGTVVCAVRRARLPALCLYMYWCVCVCHKSIFTYLTLL